MSYSFDMDGWELFKAPFGTSVRTAPPKQQTGQQKQKPPGAARQNTTPTTTQRSTLPTQKAPQPSGQAADTQQQQSNVQKLEPTLETATSAPKEKLSPIPKQANNPNPEQAVPAKAPVPANTQPAAPQKELVLDMSSSSGTATAADDAAKRKAHEESEAKRKAGWEAKQLAKKQAEEETLQKLNAMSDEEAIAASVKRVGTDTERLTRRNMKECVAEHIQKLCRENPVFARKTMHPRKNMIRCFKYINRMARDYVKQEMEDNDIKPDGNGYGCDVPDGLCYQWAEDYFNSTDAPEDQEKEETFIPKPYVGASSKPAKKKETKPKKQQKKPSDGYEQMSLEGVIG